MIMTVETFLALLMGLSALSSLATEAVKKLFPKASSNVIAACTAVCVGVAGVMVYMISRGNEITGTVAAWGVIMGLACGLCSMVGYDKVKQAITQIKGE